MLLKERSLMQNCQPGDGMGGRWSRSAASLFCRHC